MSRAGFLLAVLLAACGKSKDTAVAQGSAMGSESRTGSAEPVTLALPTVAGHGYEPSAHPARVSVSPTAIVVDGKSVSGVEGVVAGLSSPSSAPRFIVALDAALEYRLFVQLLTVLKTQGLTQYGLLAQKMGGDTVMLPLDLRDRAAVVQPRRAPGSDLQQQLEEIKKAGAQVKVGPSVGGRAAPSSGSGTTSEDEPPSTVVVEVREVSLSPESSLSIDIAKAKISATYLTGLRRCVKSFAEKDATTTSSFTLSFAISESGAGTDAKATGVTNQAADCIAKQAATWRFPIPKDAERKGVRVAATASFDITVDETTVRENARMMPGETASLPAPDPGDALGLVVSITSDEVLVWSISGLEGTRDKPRARVPLVEAPQKLSALLEDIVKRRWGGGAKRAEQDLDVIVMSEPTTKMQLLAELLGSVRATPAGTPLFPSVLFGLE